eukprot:109659-Amphidinium_carterae.2
MGLGMRVSSVSYPLESFCHIHVHTKPPEGTANTARQGVGLRLAPSMHEVCMKDQWPNLLQIGSQRA